MGYDSSALLEALSRFARLLPTPYEVESALNELTSSVTTVFRLTGAGVTFNQGDQLRFVGARGTVVEAMERCQERTQQGPCVDCNRTGEPVAVSDLRDRCVDRWPEYTAVAAGQGVRAVAGIPMRLSGEKVGAVNLYDRAPRVWPRADLDAAGVLADMATGYIVNSNKWLQQQQVTEQLQRALDSRVVIEQAKGIIANARGIGPDEAFVLIRNYARAQQAKLHTVAQAIIEVGLRL
ncbi:GAF and ANTAR domain-containing protein [Nocardia goodfellowii]